MKGNANRYILAQQAPFFSFFFLFFFPADQCDAVSPRTSATDAHTNTHIYIYTHTHKIIIITILIIKILIFNQLISCFTSMYYFKTIHIRTKIHFAPLPNDEFHTEWLIKTAFLILHSGHSSLFLHLIKPHKSPKISSFL